MFLGIDVGGTHTDAVAIDASGVKAAAKIPTDHDNLLRPIRAALRAVLSQVDPKKIKRLNLSTTLSTNSIIEGKAEDVGVIVCAGPGVDPENYRIGGHYYVIEGSIDHRGTLIQDLDSGQLDDAVDSCRKAGVAVYAAVGKFSTRNPAHEDAIMSSVESADFITKGHTLSGVLNFPRRVATAYFNSAVWRIYNDFAWAVGESVGEFGLKAEINVLKADGGTMPLEASKCLPVNTILSGPAASVMGIAALCDIQDDCIILDIGGTTTDIAVFAGGAPITEKEGMTVGSYATLVRALKICSIGVGGDSTLHFSGGNVTVGPDRSGPSLAGCALSGGLSCDITHGRGHTAHLAKGNVCVPALTDAMNYLGLAEFGDIAASKEGVKRLSEVWGLTADHLANRAVSVAVERIREAAFDLVDEINDKPVYTLFELLQGKKIEPQKIYVMGGPARAFADLLSASFGMEVVVPEHFAVANAIGAALTRTTLDMELFADTHKGVMFVPSLNISRKIPPSYSLELAREDVSRLLLEYLKKNGHYRRCGRTGNCRGRLIQYGGGIYHHREKHPG